MVQKPQAHTPRPPKRLHFPRKDYPSSEPLKLRHKARSYHGSLLLSGCRLHYFLGGSGLGSGGNGIFGGGPGGAHMGFFGGFGSG